MKNFGPALSGHWLSTLFADKVVKRYNTKNAWHWVRRHFQLSRASNCLETENINTVRDLVERTEDQLMEVRNFGETTLTEVRDKLTELGLHLGMRVPPASTVR